MSRRFMVLVGLIGALLVNGAVAQDAMFVDSSGNVGIGTNTPATSLHTLRSNGSSQILVQDNGAADPLQMFKLENNGGFPRFTFEDGSRGFVWDFRLAGIGSGERFEITKVGTGGSEFRVFANGDAELPNGTLIEGSSRAIKDEIVEIDASTVLAKLEGLRINEWSYTNGRPDRHVGPMAEDFYATFGLGPDNKHIAPKDLAGVALAAAKALKEDNDELRAENETLKARLDAIEAKLNE